MYPTTPDPIPAQVPGVGGRRISVGELQGLAGKKKPQTLQQKLASAQKFAKAGAQASRNSGNSNAGNLFRAIANAKVHKALELPGAKAIKTSGLTKGEQKQIKKDITAVKRAVLYPGKTPGQTNITVAPTRIVEVAAPAPAITPASSNPASAVMAPVEQPMFDATIAPTYEPATPAYNPTDWTGAGPATPSFDPYAGASYDQGADPYASFDPYAQVPADPYAADPYGGGGYVDYSGFNPYGADSGYETYEGQEYFAGMGRFAGAYESRGMGSWLSSALRKAAPVLGPVAGVVGAINPAAGALLTTIGNALPSNQAAQQQANTQAQQTAAAQAAARAAQQRAAQQAAQAQAAINAANQRAQQATNAARAAQARAASAARPVPAPTSGGFNLDSKTVMIGGAALVGLFLLSRGNK